MHRSLRHFKLIVLFGSFGLLFPLLITSAAHSPVWQDLTGDKMITRQNTGAKTATFAMDLINTGSLSIRADGTASLAMPARSLLMSDTKTGTPLAQTVSMS